MFKEELNNNVFYSGYLIDILNDISKHCNFTYILTECSGGVHGIRNRTQWTGCIGDLVHHVSLRVSGHILYRIIIHKQK